MARVVLSSVRSFSCDSKVFLISFICLSFCRLKSKAVPAVARAAAPVMKKRFCLAFGCNVGHSTETRRTVAPISVEFQKGGWLRRRFLG